MNQTIREIAGARMARSICLPRSDAAAPSLFVRIYPVNGIEEPQELPASTLLVGRDPQSSLALCDDSVSRRHAVIEPSGDGHTITDLGSTNGTFVNEEPINGTRRLAAGDRVRFGNQIFKYLIGDRLEAQYHEVIFKLMTTDGLTGAHNKRFFLDTLERELVQSRRSAAPLCLLMLDLDRFKSINDTCGHLAGDAVLTEFARRAMSVLRSGDLFARYGGEEFAMLLTRTNPADAVRIAERVRAMVAEAPIEFEGRPISFTVSIGVASHDGQTDCEALELIAAADRQLYVAKHGGRNQVRQACADLTSKRPDPASAGV